MSLFVAGQVLHLPGTGSRAGCLAAEQPAPGSPALPGLHRLTDLQAGQVLLNELACARCHPGLPSQSLAPKPAPDLTRVGQRVTPGYLERFLAQPTVVHPQTTMPDVLGDRPPAERQAIATALTHFLLSQTNTLPPGSARSQPDRTQPDRTQPKPTQPPQPAPGTPQPPGVNAPPGDQTAGQQPDTATPEHATIARGRQLYHRVGCVACHGPREQDATRALTAPASSPPSSDGTRPAPAPAPATQPAGSDAEGDDDEDDDDDETRPRLPEFRPIELGLAHVAGKYHLDGLAEFLHEPLPIRAGGRMPDLKLTRDEAAAIAHYLLTSPAPEASRSKEHPAGEPGVPAPPTPPAFQPDPVLVATGERHFRELSCVNCHPLPGLPAGTAAAAPLTSLPEHVGCLGNQPGRGARYDLNPAQRAALRAALAHPASAESDSDQLAKTLVTQRCIACHGRDDYGGVHPTHDPYFTTTEPNLGDEGRLPPPLTLLGAKLQPAWLKKVLFDGESVRPYLGVRMPQYGTANLAHLPGLVARLDSLPPVDWKIPSPEREADRERERALRKAGHELLGNQGLYCIACHNFNGKQAPVNRGLELPLNFQRLQPAWFNAFLRNPQAFRPRIIMPQSWANGVASHKTILEGDTDSQIQAIWYYLSLGTSAADPPGLKGIDTRLAVLDRPRIHRGRSRVAGYRGIAVGFPGQLNYAFNAETGTLSAVWRGPFVSVNWSGQGSGDFHPAAEPVQLAQDVSLLQPVSADDPWPLLPVMTKDNRVNPNPLYPKNLGYRFLGYQLDRDGVPAFRYRLHEIEVVDRVVTGGSASANWLERRLEFHSPTPQVAWFRALTGEISTAGDGVYESGRLRLTLPLPPGQVVIRQLSAEPPRSELLLKLNLPQGTFPLELRYEPLAR